MRTNRLSPGQAVQFEEAGNEQKTNGQVNDERVKMPKKQHPVGWLRRIDLQQESISLISSRYQATRSSLIGYVFLDAH